MAWYGCSIHGITWSIYLFIHSFFHLSVTGNPPFAQIPNYVEIILWALSLWASSGLIHCSAYSTEYLKYLALLIGPTVCGYFAIEIAGLYRLGIYRLWKMVGTVHHGCYEVSEIWFYFMKMSWHGNALHLTASLWGESTRFLMVFPHMGPVMQNVHIVLLGLTSCWTVSQIISDWRYHHAHVMSL